MRTLEVQIIADTVQIKGKESGVCAVIKRTGQLSLTVPCSPRKSG